MGVSKPGYSDRLYAALLRLLPFDFRSEFGGDMEETFRAQRDDAERSSGFRALLRIWWATIVDIVAMAPREHWSVLRQDVRYALRMMRKNSGYTAVAVAILAVGIGVNTAVFSMVNAVLFRPLPYLEGDRLIVLRQTAHKAGFNDLSFSAQEIADYRRRNRTLSGLVEYHSMSFTLYGGDEARSVRTGVVSAEFFDFFGIKPLIGRSFLPADDRPGAQPVLMLSYEFWKRHEAGNPGVIGKQYQMNDRPHIVIGVLPPIPQYPNDNDVYMPTSACPFRSSQRALEDREYRMMSVFARLKPGVPLDHCHSDLAGIATQLEREYPKDYPSRIGYSADAGSLRHELTQQARPLMLALVGAAAFVLLIACANVANLILARMAQREHELVIRTAIGAGSGRLLRQLLTESMMMALAAAALGVACAAGSMKLLAQFAAQFTPRAREIGVDGWMLGFAILCATLTAVGFGSMSALYARRDVAGRLKEGGRAGLERHRAFVRSGLVAAQVAFSYALLIGAGLMVRSFIELDRVDPGFVPQRVVAIGFELNWSKYREPADRLGIYRRIMGKVAELPGVLSAAASSSFPLDPHSIENGPWLQTFQREGEIGPQAETTPVASMRTASPEYFRALGIPVTGGRTFRDDDSQDSERVAVISRSLARKGWGDQDPVGSRVTFDLGKTWTRIVGVVGDVKEISLSQPSPDQFYVPVAQAPSIASLLARTAGDPTAVGEQVRRALHKLDPQIAITSVKTLDEARTDAEASPRTLARVFGLFAVLAFLVAIAGIASMLALWVRQRTRELGIRMALGASPREIVTSLLRQGMTQVALGSAAGIAGAMALTGLLKGLLFQVTPTDPETYAAVSAMLLLAALAACCVPARRAARINPQQALRCE